MPPSSGALPPAAEDTGARAWFDRQLLMESWDRPGLSPVNWLILALIVASVVLFTVETMQGIPAGAPGARSCQRRDPAGLRGGVRAAHLVRGRDPRRHRRHGPDALCGAVLAVGGFSRLRPGASGAAAHGLRQQRSRLAARLPAVPPVQAGEVLRARPHRHAGAAERLARTGGGGRHRHAGDLRLGGDHVSL